MRRLFYLIMLSVLITCVESCKGKSRKAGSSGRLRPTTTTTTASSVYGKDEEDYDWPKKARRPRKNFVVHVYNRQLRLNGTGVRVLPGTLIVPYQIVKRSWSNKLSFTELLEDGSVNYVQNLRTIKRPGRNDKHDFTTVYIRDDRIIKKDIAFRTIPLATRTDTLSYRKCSVYVMYSNATIAEYIVHTRVQCTEEYLVCAENKKNYCFQAMGSVLVCDGRLLGMRKDNETCSKSLLFYSVPYFDYWLTYRLYPKGYYTYDDMIKHACAPEPALAYKILVNIFIIIILYII